MESIWLPLRKISPLRRATDQILSNAGVAPSIVMEFDNVETVKRAIEINAGLAILPASTVKNEVDRNQLVTYKLEGGIHNRPLAVIYKRIGFDPGVTFFRGTHESEFER